MKHTVLYLLAIMVFFSCDKDDETMDGVDYAYHSHIKSPKNETFSLGDTLHINVLFESHSGEIVHNIQVDVLDVNDGNKVLVSEREHAHKTESSYDYHLNVVLSAENGFSTTSTYIVKAAVWGEAGETDGYSEEEASFSIQ